MWNYFSGMNIPKPMHSRTYQRIAKKVCQASLQALSDCFKKAAQKVCSYCIMKVATLNDGSVIDIAISLDGTWHRRGHSSHHGVGTATHIETGLGLDVEMLNNYCKSCKNAPNVEDPAYSAWQAQLQEDL